MMVLGHEMMQPLRNVRPSDVPEMPHHVMPDREVYDEPKDVIQCGDERTGRQGRVDFETI